MTDIQAFLSTVHQRKHAIVWSDEIVLIRTGQYGPSRTAHSGVNHHEVDGASRKIRVGLGERQCSIKNVECLHRMADINDLSLGGDAKNCPFDSAYKMIVQAKISRQRDDRAIRQVGPLN